MTRDPSARLGEGDTGSKEVQAEAFWRPLEFEQVLRRAYTPVWAPDAALGFQREGEQGEEPALPEDEDSDDDDDRPTDLFRGFSYRRESDNDRGSERFSGGALETLAEEQPDSDRQ